MFANNLGSTAAVISFYYLFILLTLVTQLLHNLERTLEVDYGKGIILLTNILTTAPLQLKLYKKNSNKYSFIFNGWPNANCPNQKGSGTMRLRSRRIQSCGEITTYPIHFQ